jgi:hypothetical protein
MDNTSVHRELLLPAPTKEMPTIPPLVWTSGNTFWLEIHRQAGGRVRYAVGSTSESELESMMVYLENTRARVSAGPAVDCPLRTRVGQGVFARAVPFQRHHYLPVRVSLDSDPSGFLLRTLSSRTLQGHDVVLQLLFRRVRVWESSFLSPLYDDFARRQNRDLRIEMDARRGEPAYHVELRTRLNGPQPLAALEALSAWLEQWTLLGGFPWRSWKVISTKAQQEFNAALLNHDLAHFSNRKGRRDVSATELAHLLSIPWASHHPECSYAGAPSGQPGSGLVLRPSASQVPDPRLVVGTSGIHWVALPQDWNHLAILGRTQSGKSTLALNLVLQILWKQPAASVVVIEPTGTLVEGVVARLPRKVTSDAVEIDPAHATFQQDGTTMVSVPLSLLRQPDGGDDSDTERERWAEALASDLLTAIRNAWGEESIGGRAELILRALVQGLSLTPRSNLVDAYHILSSKQALQRFVQTSPPGPLRNFLESHLPRLGYDFTMSSLDKVGKIATNPLLRVALCQRSHPVSFDQLLRHRLLLLNLSKAAVGVDGANFLGAIYLTQLWASLQRTGRPDRPVYLILDEVHNYASPTLADMLSEGAKFGLHVVSITQYLHRVPPRMRAALVGNVDAWLLFSLGAEDMDDAWKIVNAGTHGWLPQDLVDGLRPHEVAMGVSGDLLKLRTLPSPTPDPQASELQATVTESSRRYAQPEDSEASPWLIGQEEVEGSLQSLSKGPRTREELVEATALPPDRLEAALVRSATDGDVVRGSADGKFHLTARGSLHLRALQNRRNEGEEHVETLTELAMFLEARGIALSVPRQVAGVLLPDGQFQWGGAIYNVEVECSTVTKAAGQVVRNVKKARTAGWRVLIVLPDRSRLPRTLALLDEAFPGLRTWSDGVGLIWKDGHASFRPYQAAGTRVWPFLAFGFECGLPDGELEKVPPPHAVDLPIATTDPLVEQVRGVVRDLVSEGNRETTTSEILRRIPPSGRGRYSERRIGAVLGFLGVRSRRVWVGEVRPHLYDLSSPAWLGPTNTPILEPDRTSGPTPGTVRSSVSARSIDDVGATDENPRSRTEDRYGPND